MKRKLIAMTGLVLCACSVPVIVTAQTGIENQKFENLKLNSSPAFVLLGIEPDNIQRPTSPSKLVAGLQNAVVDGKLQPNVAFEFNPYLLKNEKVKNPKKPDNLFDAEAYLLQHQDLAKIFWRNLSVSLATSPTDKQTFGSLKPGTGLGIGIHTLLFDGKPNQRLKNWGDLFFKWSVIRKISARFTQATVTEVANPTAQFDAIFGQIDQDVKERKRFNPLSQSEYKKFCDSLRNMVAALQLTQAGATLTGLNNWLDGLDKQYRNAQSAAADSVNNNKNPLAKEGFMLDLAAGRSFLFQDNTYEGAIGAKAAIWITPSYRFNLDQAGENISMLDAMAVFRVTWNNQQAGVDIANYFDTGAKIAYTMNKFTGSFEGVYRHASNTPAGVDKKYTYRATVGLNYKLSDAITFTFNFGTNFDGNTATYTEAKKMFAVGGLNFGLPFIQTGK